MHPIANKLLYIADTCGLEMMDDWETFQLGNGEMLFLHDITYKVFIKLIENKGSHLSKWELRDVLQIEDERILDRIFCILNPSSKNISYEEFHNFVVRGSKEDVYDILDVMDMLPKEEKEEDDDSLDDVIDVVIDDNNEETELDYKGEDGEDDEDEDKMNPFKKFFKNFFSYFNF